MTTTKTLHYLFIVSIAFLFVSCASLPGTNRNLRFTEKYQTVEFEENLNYVETNIKYPQFDKLPDLNKRIENTVLNNWKNFKSYSRKEYNDIVALNSRGNSKLPPFEYNVTYEVTGTKEIVSVLINTYIFSGGAHGTTNLISLNYNMNTKKYISILNATDMTYNEISTLCRNHLYKKLIDDNKAAKNPAEKDALREMINMGAFPQAGNYEIFTVDGARIYVYFEPYSVAPYSYGIQKIQVK